MAASQTLPCVRLSTEEADALCRASEVSCDPYDHRTWTISALSAPDESEETDVICFDHAILQDGMVILMAVLDCMLGHFVDTFACFLCTPEAALETVHAIIDDAYDWFRQTYDPEAIESNTDNWLTTLHRDLATSKGAYPCTPTNIIVRFVMPTIRRILPWSWPAGRIRTSVPSVWTPKPRWMRKTPPPTPCPWACSPVQRVGVGHSGCMSAK
jgi:hypothetical protein